uniref:SLIT and NTRK-like protein 5 n=1 Tax=Denticeps clupeoides TaxID=299321 RepID=A0AAY4DIZ3_9TELE
MRGCVGSVSPSSPSSSLSGALSTSRGGTRRRMCAGPCACEEKDGVLSAGCQNRGVVSLAEVPPLHVSTYHLLLTGNLLRKLSSDDFLLYDGVTTLHLGDNGISEVEKGAFNGLAGLKRLHLNNNKIEVLREDFFVGLESLEYLQIDYNYITSVEANAFSKLRHLEVLILNDNLLSSLPTNIFQYVPLTHLDLRGNQLKLLPYTGLLEHMNKIVELQLEENPWNCSCELIPLKAWLESISYTALVGDVVCETPFRLHGRDLDEVSKQELCPRRAIAEYEMHAEPARGSEAYFQTAPASTTSPGVLRSSRPTKGSRPSGKLRTKPTPRAPSNKQNLGPMLSYQTKSPVPLDCPTACTCNLQISDLGLNVNCQERKIEHISDLNPKPYNPKKLYLTGNYIPVVRRSDFVEATGLDLLHLGNNRISAIHDRAFGDLGSLRRLYLNGNLIERLTERMFHGLRSLQFLYLEYNVVRDITPGSFKHVPNLQLLFLNNNLLKTIPAGVFGGSGLARLNLRSNHFRHLPAGGVLDLLTSLVKVDLSENPWDCSCAAVDMKVWLERFGGGSVENGVVCETPPRLSGEDVRFVNSSNLCPNASGGRASAAPPPPSEESFPGSTITLETSLDYDAPYGAVPLSVLILVLFTLFILSVFVAAGLFAVMKRRRNKSPGGQAASVSADLASFDRSAAKVKTSAGLVYEYIPPPKTPAYGAERFRDLGDPTGAFTPNSDEELGSNAVGSDYSESAPDPRTSPVPEDDFFYRDLLPHRSGLPCQHAARDPARFSRDFDARRQLLHPERVQQSGVVYRAAPAAGAYGEPGRSEYWELKAKLHFQPDYLEVHEKRTTFTQF